MGTSRDCSRVGKQIRGMRRFAGHSWARSCGACVLLAKNSANATQLQVTDVFEPTVLLR